MSAFLELKGLTKRYGAVTAVDGVNLAIEKGRFLTLLGPSGSGKTTVLMAIAGFVEPSAGSINVNGRDVTHLAPEKRNFGMVFQGYALFPHLSVRDNVAFPLKIRGRSSSDIQAQVTKALDMVRLQHLADRNPKQLSGGQQQRVAIARALVFEPDLLLLDEPLSALDKKLRGEMQQELKDLHARLGTTFVCVTHDQDEALSMADEVAILRDGRIQQIGSPTALYENPATRFVADFLGRSNFLDGLVVRTHAGGFAYVCAGRTFMHEGAGDVHTEGHEVHISLRPEKISITPDEPQADCNTLQGTVVGTSYTGSHHNLTVKSDLGFNLAVTVAAWQSQPIDMGRRVWINWPANATVAVSNG